MSEGSKEKATLEGRVEEKGELVFPFYTRVRDIFEKRTTPKTDMIKLHTSSRENPHLKYTFEFPLETWCYVKMDEIINALADQLTTNKNLNRGLMMKMSW